MSHLGFFAASSGPQFSAPSQMASPTLTTIDTDSISVAWVPPADDGGSPITAYQLFYRTTGVGTYTFTGAIPTNGSPYAINDLLEDTEYEVGVRAYNVEAGWSPWSPLSFESTAAAPATAPGQTAAPTLTVLSSSQIRVAFSAPASGGTPTGYDIRWREQGGIYFYVYNVTSPYVLSGLDGNQLHRISTRAKNSVGEGPYSGESLATTS